MQGLLLSALQHSASCLQLGLCCTVACPLYFCSSKSRTHNQSAFYLVFLKSKPVPSFVQEHSYSTLVNVRVLSLQQLFPTVITDFQDLQLYAGPDAMQSDFIV